MTLLRQAAQKAVEDLPRYKWDQEQDDTFGYMVGPVPDGEWLKRSDVLSALQQQEVPREPVAWRDVHDHTNLYFRKPAQGDVEPLYASPSTTQQPSVAAHALNTTPVVDHATQQQEAGSGWKLVPVKPTQAMLHIAGQFFSDSDPRIVAAAYREMLAAAPSTPAREEALRLAGAAGLDPDPEVNRAACEVERDAAKCWRQSCAQAGACAAPAAGLPAVDSQTNPDGADHA